jgi:hypothetical protein
MSNLDRDQHELELARAFLTPGGRDRFLAVRSRDDRRGKFTGSLAHSPKLNWRFGARVPPNAFAPDIAKLLRARGAPETCWAVSEWKLLDGREMSLDEALQQVVGSGMGTLLSCIPGRLAYYESEEPGERWIFQRS